MPRKKSGLFDQREYVNRYHREQIARKNVTFNRGKPEDMALMEWAEKQPEGFVAYVKRLIQADKDEHDSRERFIRRADEAEKKIIDLKFPAIDGFRDDEAINNCVENDHTIYVGRFGNWEVRFDADAKKVLTVRNLSNLTIEP